MIERYHPVAEQRLHLWLQSEWLNLSRYKNPSWMYTIFRYNSCCSYFIQSVREQMNETLCERQRVDMTKLTNGSDGSDVNSYPDVTYDDDDV